MEHLLGYMHNILKRKEGKKYGTPFRTCHLKEEEIR